jgi:hypothetical protein
MHQKALFLCNGYETSLTDSGAAESTATRDDTTVNGDVIYDGYIGSSNYIDNFPYSIVSENLNPASFLSVP